MLTKDHLQLRKEDSHPISQISVIFWTGALLRSTAARRRDATSRTPHSQKHTPASISTKLELLPRSPPPRELSPRTTSTSPGSAQWNMHSPYTYWYNITPSIRYSCIAASGTPSPLSTQLVYPHERPMDPTICPGLPSGVYSPPLPTYAATNIARLKWITSQ